ncbi:MAG: glycosyltransferase family 39 protein [Chthoniobacteraceae bacterium]
MPIPTAARTAARRWFWLLLGCGVLLRCVALTQPLVDAHLLRQGQTAAATRSLLAEPGIVWRIPWVGDFVEHYVLELPLYNYLTMAVHALGPNPVVAGKLVSIALWAFSFWLLQGIWQRTLDPTSAGWANLIFVVSPLGVFFGQAVTPEMLLQVLAFAFVLLLIRYDEQPCPVRWFLAAATGLLSLLIKAPGVAHLYLVLVFLIVARGGWKMLFLPRHVVAGLLSAACLFAWAQYVGSVNRTPLSFGGAEAHFRGFIGPLAMRFALRPWLMVAIYLGALLIPAFALLVAMRGGWRVVREGCARPLAAWLVSLVPFYLLWLGNGPASQSYYNLPTLAPAAALFGLGMSALLADHWVDRWRTAAAALAGAITIGCAVPGIVYLFTPDRALLAAAQWTRTHTEPDAVVLFRAAHRSDMVEYGVNAAFPFNAERRAFIWTAELPEPYRTAALERSTYAVVTKPLPTGRAAAWLRQLRHQPEPVAESTEWLRKIGFAPVAEEAGFVAFRRQ